MVRALRFLAAMCVLGTLAACGTAAGASRSFGNDELLKDIADRLGNADTLSYTADFSLPNHTAISITHAAEPSRTAYHYPGGMVLVTPNATAVCTIGKSTRCTELASSSPGSAAARAVDSALEHVGIIRPEAVIALLNHMALNHDAIVNEADRTLAGTNATCIVVSGVSAADRFSTCVTSEGLLGLFTGKASGQTIDVEMNHYLPSAAETAFALPPTT